MSVMKRTYLYLIRKKEQTISLFILVFLLSTFLLTCFSLLKATDESARTMRTSIGGAFKIYAKPNLSIDKDGNVKENIGDIPVIKENKIKYIMANKEIKYYNAANFGYCKSDAVRFIPGEQDNDDNNMGQLNALNYSSLDDSFSNKTFKLIKGRHITSIDKNSVVINSKLAKRNKIEVGDTIKFTHAMFETDGPLYVDSIREKTAFQKATVIGIYKIMKSQPNVQYQPTAGRYENQVFSDHTLSRSLKLSKKGQYVDGVSFFVKDPMTLGNIVDDIRKSGIIDENKFAIKANDFNYKKIGTQLQSIQKLVYFLIIGVTIVSLIILMLMLFLRIRNRMHESGIMLSIGASKVNILSQFILEVMIISGLAYILAYFASDQISEILINKIMTGVNQPSISREVIETGVENFRTHWMSLKLKNMEIVRILLLEGIVLITSVLIAATTIIKLKPKEILSKIS